jgi:hypothetical protein
MQWVCHSTKINIFYENPLPARDGCPIPAKGRRPKKYNFLYFAGPNRNDTKFTKQISILSTNQFFVPPSPCPGTVKKGRKKIPTLWSGQEKVQFF